MLRYLCDCPWSISVLDSQTVTTDQDNWKDEYIRNYYEYTQSLTPMKNTKMPASSDLDKATRDTQQSLLDSATTTAARIEKTVAVASPDVFSNVSAVEKLVPECGSLNSQTVQEERADSAVEQDCRESDSHGITSGIV